MSKSGSSTSGLIRSIQQGVITIASNQASGTATISAVNTAKSAVFVNSGKYTQSAETPAATVALTNSTTITVTRASNPAYTCDIGYLVLEFL